MTTPAYLVTSAGRSIAYHRTEAKGDKAALPGLVFLGGFLSDMEGTKARWVEAWARARGVACLRFDYSGHGASSEKFEEGCIGDWAEDAVAAFEELTDGSQILVGSSMGGWIALLLARRFPGRVAGLVGIAAAPDFTELIWQEMTEDQRETLLRDGVIHAPSDYSEEPTPITSRLIEEGRQHLLLDAGVALDCPVRLLHGLADEDVKPAIGMRLIEAIEGDDVRLTLVKGADHRFSSERELALIGRELEELLR